MRQNKENYKKYNNSKDKTNNNLRTNQKSRLIKNKAVHLLKAPQTMIQMLNSYDLYNCNILKILLL